MLCIVMTASYSYAQRSGNFGDRNGGPFGGYDGFGDRPGESDGYPGSFDGHPGGPGGHHGGPPIGGFGGMLQSFAPPIVSSDGTTYIVDIVPPEFEEGEEFDHSDIDSSSILTTLSAITPDGGKTSTTLTGNVVRPFVSEDNTLLAATSSFPDLGESVLYLIGLPFDQDKSALEVSLDGNIASMPFILNDTRQIYLTVVKIGIDGEGFEDLDPKDFDPEGFEEIEHDVQRFLYIIGFDGSVVSKIEI